MKKQFKLLSTIASLVLAVSLLAFGVYSATAVSFNITNTITYTFSDVLVDVNTSLYRVKTGTTAIITEEALGSYTDTNWEAVEGGVTNGTLKSYTGSNGVYTQDDAASTVNSSINFNMNNAYAYMVKVDITTLNTAGVTVSYNDTAFVDSNTDDNFTLVVTAPTDLTITPEETCTLTYYVLLEDSTVEINEATVPTLNITINKA